MRCSRWRRVILGTMFACVVQQLQEDAFDILSNCASDISIMLGDDEDVFDSVTWESSTNIYDADDPAPSGPGFRQSTVADDDGRGPNDPKWEGYLITSVKDPVKELAETKDAYVSYLVSAKVGSAFCTLCHSNSALRPTYLYSPLQTRHHAGVSRTSSSSETIWSKISRLV